MTEAVDLKLTELFVILFVTLGPVKIILPFMEITSGLKLKDKISVALRAELISALVVFVIILAGPYIIEKWQLSSNAIAITGAIIMFFQGYVLVKKNPADIGNVKISSASNTGNQVSLLKYAYLLVIPVIITPAGITALLSVTSLRHGACSEIVVLTLKLLVVILLSNLIIMLLTPFISKVIRPIFFQITSWIFSIFLMILAVDIFIRVVLKLISGIYSLP